MASFTWPGSSGGGGGGDVNIFDSSGGTLNSTAGALNVHLDAGSLNLSVGATGAAVPVDATYLGIQNGSGNLTGLIADFGASSAGLRVSSLIGNATGIADFAAGNSSAQTLRVVIASNQVAIPASQSGTWNINNISGTVSLPTGAATETTLAAISAKFGSLGQKTMAGSAPVVIASDQASIPVTVSGVATAANQATEIASLASIDGKLVDNFGSATAGLRTAAQVGNATGAADFGAGNKGAQTLRVVIATDQTSIPTSSGGNVNGSNTDSTVSTVATLTAPANTVGFILMNLDTSTANVRWRIGATATSASGQQLQPGRDTGYIPCAANISICAESGTQNYNIQWILSV